MPKPKHGRGPVSGPTDTPPRGERRRMSRIVHDHKGTAIVQWYDAPAEYDRPVLEIEDARPSAKPAETGAKTGAAPNPGLEPNTGSLSVERNDDSHPGLLLPGADGKRAPGHR